MANKAISTGRLENIEGYTPYLAEGQAMVFSPSIVSKATVVLNSAEYFLLVDILVVPQGLWNPPWHAVRNFGAPGGHDRLLPANHQRSVGKYQDEGLIHIQRRRIATQSSEAAAEDGDIDAAWPRVDE